MSVVIIGGHDRMVCQYKKICKSHKCKAKVFTQMSADLDKQIGDPDLCILFVATQAAVQHWRVFYLNMLYKK